MFFNQSGKDRQMSNATAATANYRRLISRAARILERTGLAMAGAMCGTFVAAYLSRAGIDTFGSIGFIASMILTGAIGFYLGIDIPMLYASRFGFRAKRVIPEWDIVELLGAAGTFLASMAALTSVYTLVFDQPQQELLEFAIGAWWLLGVTMQIGAGAFGRWRPNKLAG
jgi:hypothetical protein